MNYEELLEKVLEMDLEKIESNPLFDCVLCINDLSYWNDPNEIMFTIEYLEKRLNEIGIKIDPYDSWFDLQDQLIEKINKMDFKDLNCKFQ